MNKFAFAFAATIALTSLSVSTAEAMTIGSLSRLSPVTADTELTTSSIPKMGRDFGGGGAQSGSASPVIHIIFASISGMLRSHLDHAFGSAAQARIQLISTASAD